MILSLRILYTSKASASIFDPRRLLVKVVFMAEMP